MRRGIDRILYMYMYMAKVITFILAQSQSVRLHALEIGELQVYMSKRHSDHWLKYVCLCIFRCCCTLISTVGFYDTSGRSFTKNTDRHAVYRIG